MLLVVAESPSAKVGLLECEGWTVRAFRRSEAALHAFNTEPHFDAVVTDRAPLGAPGLMLLASLRETLSPSEPQNQNQNEN